MKPFHVQQGSEEWVRLRLGVPTSSDFDKIMTPTKMLLSSSADKYIARLIGEKLSPYLPERAESFSSRAMVWGQQTEEEARRFYAMEKGVEVDRSVGFCLSDDGLIGCSPDGLIGEDGGLELKCPQSDTHVRYLLGNTLPDDYKPQVHGSLIVTGRQWWDFMSYSIGLPPLIIRVTPNLYTEQLRKCLYEEFLPKYQDMMGKVKSLSGHS